MLNYTFHKFIKASPQKGGALIYILIAIALLAALTSTFLDGGGQSSRTQNAFKTATVLNSQARLIRSALQDCVLRYPEGDSGDITDPAPANYIDPYPLMPTSTDFSSPAADNNIERLGCPGTSSGAGVDDHVSLFSGTGEFSSFLPSPPDLMEPWIYFNNNITASAGAPGYNMAFNGVFFQIQSDKSDPFIGEAYQKVDELMSSCEVDHQVGTGTNGCENGHQCLRFWIIRRGGGPTGTADATNGQNPCP